MGRYISGYAVFRHSEDGYEMDYNSLSSDLEQTMRHRGENDVIRKVRINYGGEEHHNHDYLGFGFKYGYKNTLIVHSIQETRESARLRGGEGKLYSVRLIAGEVVQGEEA